MPRCQTHVILNPMSAGGRTGRLRAKLLGRLQDYLGGEYSVHITKRPLDAVRSAEQAAAEGCSLIVSVGGDGTINEIINGLLKDKGGRNSRCELGIVSSGTGHGLAQSLNLPRSTDGQIQVIAGGLSRHIDLGRVTYQAPDGSTQHRLFVSECQFGIGAAVARRLSSRQKRLGGLLGYGLATLSVVASYSGSPMDLVMDGETEISCPLDGVSVGNGDRCAGGMRLVPKARLDDGILDALVIHKQSVARRLLSVPKLYSGRHVRSPAFGYLKARSLSIRAPRPIPVAADGESLGSTPCAVEVIPSALAVRVPPALQG